MKSALLIGVVSPAAIRENDVEKNILNAETDFTWDLQNVICYKRKLIKKNHSLSDIYIFYRFLYIYIFFRIVVLDPPISSTRVHQGELTRTNKRIRPFIFIIIKSINLKDNLPEVKLTVNTVLITLKRT